MTKIFAPEKDVESISATKWVVSTREITIIDTTEVVGTIAVGDKVTVQGILSGDGTVTAVKIELSTDIDNGNADDHHDGSVNDTDNGNAGQVDNGNANNTDDGMRITPMMEIRTTRMTEIIRTA
ncbi:MAG TPA: DUF5666 domain-containing protein [Anaerolineaceae bacterium]|nr:DUF5666 domain-containing protein [Anaerolineaceae bacterium]